MFYCSLLPSAAFAVFATLCFCCFLLLLLLAFAAFCFRCFRCFLLSLLLLLLLLFPISACCFLSFFPLLLFAFFPLLSPSARIIVIAPRAESAGPWPHNYISPRGLNCRPSVFIIDVAQCLAMCSGPVPRLL